MMHSKGSRGSATAVLTTGLTLLLASSAFGDIEPLTEAPPTPANLGKFVRDLDALERLGKALFWDEQVGSDGRVACATCHHQAGADSRITNRVNPRDTGFQSVSGPGETLRASDFPIRSDDVVGSSGVDRAEFVDVIPGSPVDACVGTPAAPFHGFRQVTGRDAQTNINAVFNELQLWDGRASNVFNGVDPSGDTSVRVLRVTRSGDVKAVKLRRGRLLDNSSLASQAVGPPPGTPDGLP